MTIQNVGPGGVSNSYGSRSTKSPSQIKDAGNRDGYSGFAVGAPLAFSRSAEGNPTGLAAKKADGSSFPFAKPIRTISVVGDSITQLGSTLGLPFTKTTTIAGICNSDQPVGSLNTPDGVGTLTYNAAAATITWQAPTDVAAGPAVKAVDGVFVLASATPSYTLTITVTKRLLPNVSATATYTSGTRLWRRSLRGWYYVIDSMTRGRFNFKIFGIGGNYSTDIANRYDQILNSGADIIIDECGTNDIGAAGMSPEESAATRAANWDKALAKGIPVIAMLISPRWGLTDTGAATPDSAGYTAEKQAKIVAANLLYIKESRNRPGVYIADNYSKNVIASDPKGALRNGYSSDGIHPEGAAAYEYAEPVARILNNLVPDDGVSINVGLGASYDATFNTTGNLLRNGQGSFLGTGGTANTGVTTGTGLAANWIASRNGGSAATAVANKAAATDGGPDWQEFVISGAVDSTPETFLFYPQTILSANYTAGDLLNGQVEFEVTGTGCAAIRMDVAITGGTLSAWEAQQMTRVYQGIRHNGIVKLESLVLPPGVTVMQPRLQVHAAAGGSFTIRFRNLTINKGK